MTNSAKNYCFTLNNYTPEELEHLKTLYDDGLHRYLCFGIERGDQGTPHIQGYISFVKRRTLGWLKSHVSNRAHFEQAQGSPAQNREYCQKEEDQAHGSFFEFGDIPGGQGCRNDTQRCLESIKQQKSIRELADEHGKYLLRYSRGINLLRSIYSPLRSWKSQVFVYYGKSGTGKTRKAYSEMCEEKAWFYPGQGWFDGYDGDEDVIFDDFGGTEFKITYLLKLLDRYPMRVAVKGGFVNWVPKRIFLTSNYSPEEWYPNAKEEHQIALNRRIEIKEYFPL